MADDILDTSANDNTGASGGETPAPDNTGADTLLGGDAGKQAEGGEEQKPGGAPEEYADFTLGEGVEIDKATLEQVKADFKAAGYTQEQAQKALLGLTNAVVSKDKIRAHLGALQNRLENTISNLSTQAENLQAAESRISDVDVATEMTQFVRNQILTQSSVAMLSQANSMPKLALNLISG